MTRTIRFHLDEPCDPAIAAGLRRRGIGVTTTAEAGLLSAADEQHAAYALAETRVIFTQDRDFLRLHAAGQGHAGIAYCRPGTRSIGQVIDLLVLIWDLYDPAEMTNRVEFI